MELTKNREGLELRFFELSQSILNQLGLEMYDLEWNPSSQELRLFIMDPKTKSAQLEDCVKVDRAFNPYMEESWIPENFTLEVSSPGLYRNLSTSKHFKDVEGEEVTLLLHKKIDEAQSPDFPKALRNNMKIKVKLVEAKESSLIIEAKGIKVEVPYEQIKKANLETNINNHQLK